MITYIWAFLGWNLDMAMAGFYAALWLLLISWIVEKYEDHKRGVGK